MSHWYHDSISIWTLDYPPFFAYFEYLISTFIYPPSKFAHRLSVIVSELLLLLSLDNIVVLYASPGLLMIDHIHFQYNGFLFAILLLSLTIMPRNVYLASFLFASLINFKHIFLYISLPYFIYLLSICIQQRDLKKLVGIGASTITPFIISIYPFRNQIPQLLSRLFPFKRGLTHVYWAPNFWALYSFSDRVLMKMNVFLFNKENIASSTRGILGDEFSILPNVSPMMTFIITLVLQLPFLLKLFNKPSIKLFIETLIISGFTSFLFGWHVHEKAILIVLVPFSMVINTVLYKKLFWLASWFGYFSLFPLLFQDRETIVKILLFLCYMMYLRNEFKVSFGRFEVLYLGLSVVGVVLEFWNDLFIGKMFYSVYCSIGLFYVFGWFSRLVLMA